MSTNSGLATAFYRLYILCALEERAARPAALLAALHAREGALPLPTGAYSRALQQLLDAGLIAAGAAGAVELTAFGRREREEQHQVWRRVLGLAGQLLAGDVPEPEPPQGGSHMPAPPVERVAEQYRERVVIAEVRGAIRRAREDGHTFALAVALLGVSHPQPARARAMLHRALREALATARSTFGPDAVALRYGPHGIALLLPAVRADTGAELLRARLGESLAAMTATVRAFAGARWAVQVGLARWTPAIITSGELIRAAEASAACEQLERAA